MAKATKPRKAAKAEGAERPEDAALRRKNAAQKKARDKRREAAARNLAEAKEPPKPPARPKVKAKAKPPKLKPAKWKEDLRVLHPLPVPQDLADAPVAADAPVPKRVRKAESRHLGPLDPSRADPAAAVLDRLWATVEERRVSGDATVSHSARLLARGTAKVAQKLGEEAVEAVIEAMAGNRPALIGESADLLYHLIVLWVDAGIRPEEVWAELVRREGISGIAEKASRQNLSSAGVVKAGQTTKLP